MKQIEATTNGWHSAALCSQFIHVVLKLILWNSLKRVMLAVGVNVIKNNMVSERCSEVGHGGRVRISQEDFFGHIIAHGLLRINPASAPIDRFSEAR
jgi:hypothetical protein